MTIDLRSDTVTRPTPEMKEFMLQAKLGDDVFGQDPSVNELQDHAADLFRMEAALFCPSGTMSNQIAIKTQTQPGDEVICESGAHIHYYEGGGLAFNSGVTTNAINGDRGVFSAEQVEAALRPKNVHFATTSLVSIENTCNRGGGRVFPFEEILRIKDVCNKHDLKLHLDGARLFNALVADQRSPKEFGTVFDSISVCLSKGLGAPVGSLLLGSSDLVAQATRIRKVLGGGMRQAGIIASAGLFALRNNIDRIKLDHELAKQIGLELLGTDYVRNVFEVETNIVVFELRSDIDTQHFLQHLYDNEIQAFEVGLNRIRFVTHLDLPSDTLSRIRKALISYSAS
jgi:threonine aldolase